MHKIVLLLMLFPAIILGQETHDKNLPEYFLNGEKIEMGKSFINTENIIDVSVKKNTDNGQIFITTKDAVTFVNLIQLSQENDINGSNALFLINGKPINKPSEVVFDKSLLKTIAYEESTTFENIKSDFKIIMIETKDTEKEKSEGEVIIRGVGK